MKLYYAPGSCALASHIVLCEADLPFELEPVDLKTHKTQNGQDMYAINSKGYVPVLELDNGERLTEGVVIMQYIANQVPGKLLMPESGSMPHYRALEWLNFIATELHKSYGPLFNASMPAEAKQFATDMLLKRFKWIDTQLAGKNYLLGDTFCVADAYLFTIARWAPAVQVSLGNFKNLESLLSRVRARAAVQKALKAEGL